MKGSREWDIVIAIGCLLYKFCGGEEIKLYFKK
jgi:hypothetical protein